MQKKIVSPRMEQQLLFDKKDAMMEYEDFKKQVLNFFRNVKKDFEKRCKDEKEYLFDNSKKKGI